MRGQRDVLVAGVGMIPFTKPGVGPAYDGMGAEAIRRALADGGLAYDQVDQAYAGYVYGDSCCGQKAIYAAGMTGIAIVNVNNNCATGSTALFLARQAVASGAAECVLAVGFEEMRKGAIAASFADRLDPLRAFTSAMEQIQGALETRLEREL